jgi:hypothetical protein
MLMLASLFVALVGPAAPVSANNETTSGVISGTETWSGTHTLSGDVVIASGSKLIIQPGTTVIFPNGTHLDVRGNLCAGVSNCGASGNSNTAQRITFRWTDPANASATGECYGMSYGNQQIWIKDPSCYEGVLIRNTIDLSQTGLRHIVIDGAWGIPYYIPTVYQWRYGAMVIDGASPVLTEIEFTDINTTSLLTTNLAQPRLIGGEYTVGNDDESNVGGSAVQIYGSGTPVTPLIFESPTLIGTNVGCSRQAPSRPVIWAEDTFIEINGATSTGDYGISMQHSSGIISNSEFNVNCNGIDINSRKSVSNVDYSIEIIANEITTGDGAPITVFQGGLANIVGNDLEGAAESSGIAIESSNVRISNNDIGPVGGWNGLWLLGSFDVIAENNTIHDIAREVIRAGEYGSSAPAPSASRIYLANNTLSTDGTGVCTDTKYDTWGSDFTCPVVHAYRAGVSMYDNTINVPDTSDADGIRAVGAILDIQRNAFNVPGTGVIAHHYDDGYAGSQQFGTLGFFSQNSWSGVGMTYNITKSSITVQSEYIPSPPPGEYPVQLVWSDQEAWPDNMFQTSIIPTYVKECPNCDDFTPVDFPLAVNMDNNSTTFTFANLSNLDRTKIHIDTQPTPYAVQVRRAEMVRFQTLVNGERVEDANVLIEDALGNDLYSLHTQGNGYTPWFALPSDFHLDFRGLGNGDNPDGFADDEYEDSCSDGIDNDGDLTVDTNDEDCDNLAGTRELSRYYYTGYKFGSGFARSDFTLTDTTLQDTINLANLAPSVSVTQLDGHSFRKVVNLTGSAHDGQLAGIYATDELAQWDQGGYVHEIQIKDPFTSEWGTAGLAVDTSGMAEGQVTKTNRPFSSWYYQIDMSNREEGDYVFEFRAFDGIDYSPIIYRTIKLNVQAPTISVTSPSSFSTHSEGTVTFEGTAFDYYGCPIQCSSDIQDVYFHIQGPDFDVTTPADGGPDWSWTWDFSGLPRVISTYTFTVWASDADFCQGFVDECEPGILTLTIDNSNSHPFISVITPYDGQRLSVSTETVFEGVARDNDGSVSRVDFEIMDVANNYLLVLTDSITDFAPSGAWSLEWDSTNLMHDMQYLVRFRSYDGYDYSDWEEMLIVADNPPDAGNNQPTFDSTDWSSSISLYCEIDSQSQDRCTKAEIDLLEYFDDIDPGQELILSVYDDDSRTSDDHFGIVINVGMDGMATYNPVSMFFYDADMATWTLENVVFVATDTHGSKINSNPVTFTVVGLQFLITPPEETTISEDGRAIFTGIGLPGKTVTVTIAGNTVNNTVVGEDSTWSLGIPASRIDGTATPVFKYGGSEYSSTSITISDSGGGGMGMGSIIIVVLVLIAIIGGLVYFFVEFEEEEDEQLDGTSEAKQDSDEEEDTYAWAKEAGIREEPEKETSRLQKHDDHPGWLWDPDNEEWVPDPAHSDA